MTIQVAGSRRTGVATRTDDESLRTDHLLSVSNFPFFFANSPHLTLLQSVFLVTISHVIRLVNYSRMHITTTPSKNVVLVEAEYFMYHHREGQYSDLA